MKAIKCIIALGLVLLALSSCNTKVTTNSEDIGRYAYIKVNGEWVRYEHVIVETYNYGSVVVILPDKTIIKTHLSNVVIVEKGE